jgi:hypothetical protein
MANQIIIDIGAIANDGTGDPLRTAFNYVNNNFSNVWNTGLPTSNVVFSGNRLLTTNTNGNLVLAPNGIGVVQSNVSVIPNINRAHNLGSSAKKWDTLWVYYGQIDSANIGEANIASGTLTIDVGNLHISGGSNGYVLQTDGTGNLTWTAQTGGSGNGTPGGANTQVQFNNAGSFGGHPNFTYDTDTDTLSVPGNIIVDNIYSVDSTVVHVHDDLETFGDFTAVGMYLASGGSLINQGNGTVDLNSLGNVTIEADGQAWNFDTTGTLTFPDNGSGWPIRQQRYGMGNVVAWLDGEWTIGEFNGNTSAPNSGLGNEGIRIDPGIESSAGMTFPAVQNQSIQPVTIYSTGGGGINLYPGGSGSFVFAQNGNLTLPTNSSNINYANGVSILDSIGGGGNTFTSITMTNSPAGASNVIQNGLGNLTVWNDGGWTIGEWNGTTYGTEGMRINPGIEGSADIILPSDANAATIPVQVNNYAGNVSISAGNGVVYYNWLYDKTGNLTLPGNTFAVNYANGDPVSLGGGSYGDSNVVTLMANFGSNTISTTGSVTANTFVGDQANVDLVAGSHTWVFDDTGNLTLPDNSGNIEASITTVYNALQLRSNTGTEMDYYDSADLEGNHWGYISIDGTGAYIVNRSNVAGNVSTVGWTFNPSGNIVLPSGGTISEGSSPAGLGYAITLTPGGGGDADQQLKIYPTGGEGNHLHLTSGNLYNTMMYVGDDNYYVRLNTTGRVQIQANDNTGNLNQWNFDPQGWFMPPLLNTARGDNPSGSIYGYTINIGDGQQEGVITTPDGGTNGTGQSSQRLVINPGKGQDGTSGEGGDIYLWAGRGGSGDAGNAVPGGTGGDVKIRGGQGMLDADGGYIRIEGGDSSGSGTAGYVQVKAGYTSGGTPGYVSVTGGYNSAGPGGDVTITGGDGGGGYNGGNVDIVTGSGSNNGNVNISTGSSGIWTFANNGNLYTPEGGQIRASSPNYGISVQDYSSNSFVSMDSVNMVVQGNAAVTIATNGGTQFVFTNGSLNAGNANISTTGNIAGHGGVFSANVAMGTAWINNLSDPVQAQDAATKKYVDDNAAGLNIHDAALLASTQDLATYTGATVTYNNGTAGVGANLVLSGNTLTTLDGTAITGGSSTRLLIKNQANAVQNGVYTYTSNTVLTRATDMDQASELTGGDYVFVQTGATQASSSWVQQGAVGNVGVGNVTFVQFSASQSYSAGNALTLSGSEFNVNVDNSTVVINGSDQLKVGTVPAANVSGLATVATTGNYSDLNGAYGNANVADYLAAYNGNISTTGNISGAYLFGNGSQLTGLPASYGDSNVVSLLAAFGSNTVSTTGNVFATTITLAGTGTAVNASGGNILTNKVTGTQFAFLNGLYTATLTGGGATSNYTLALPANAGSNGQVLTTDGTGSLSWTTPASTYGNSNVTTLLAAFGSNTISTTGTITSGNITGGNVLTGGLISATGNITSLGNIAGGNVLATGTVSAASYIGSVVSVTANITGGNILTGGLISATGNITSAGNISGGNIIGTFVSPGANTQIIFNDAGVENATAGFTFNKTTNAVATTGTVSATANITGGNLLTGGIVSATGSITTAANLSVNGGVISTTAATANVFNVTPTTVNIGAGASTGVNIGNASGLVTLSGNVQGSTNGFAIGYRDIPQVTFSANATIVLTDAGKHYYSTSSSNLVMTIANSTSANFAVGAAINLINQGTGTITVAQGSGVTMYLAGNSTSGNRTVASYGVATIQKVATDTWFIVGVGIT